MNDPTSLYVHIPFCARKCPYCGFFSEAGRTELIPPYLAALESELRAAPRGRPARTISVGGGTPTILSATQLGALLRSISTLVEKEPHCEFTVEANPGTLSAEKAAVLLEGGVNRISLGAQSFHLSTLQALGRIHGPDEIYGAVAALRSQGFGNIGLDLIYAVPGQTTKQWADDLEAAITLGVEHISAYGLSFDEGTGFEAARRRGLLAPVPDDEYLAMYRCARQRVSSAGFHHYEISNFALPGLESAHNCNYWLNGSYLGIGASATAFVSGRRRTNVAHIERYIAMIQSGGSAEVFSERLDPVAFARETAAFNIRYLPGIERGSFLDRTGFDVEMLFAELIGFHVGQGLLEYDGTTLRLTPEALPVADSVSGAFLEA